MAYLQKTVPVLKIPIDGFIKQGDTIDEIEISFNEDYTGDFTTATIKMQVYDRSSKLIDISNGNGITVVDSNTCKIDSINNNKLPAGIFKGDFEVTEVTGYRKTYFNVEYTILKQYTI